MGSRTMWLGAVVLGVVAARFLSHAWDPLVYVVGGTALAVVGSVESRRSKAGVLGFVLTGTGIAMLGISHLVGLPSAVELSAAVGLIAFGLVLLARRLAGLGAA